METGPYILTRNPMYLGSFLIGAGFALVVWPWWSWPIFAAFFYMRFIVQILQEEKHLAQLFPNDFTAYCQRAPRLLPSFSSALKARPRDIFKIDEAWSTKEKWGLLAWPLLAVALEWLQESLVFGAAQPVTILVVFIAAGVVLIMGFVGRVSMEVGKGREANKKTFLCHFYSPYSLLLICPNCKISTKSFPTKSFARDFIRLRFDAPAIVRKIQPGQFIHIRTSDAWSRFSAGRSACTAPKSTWRSFTRSSGPGTKILSLKKKATRLMSLGPLGGRPFQDMPPSRNKTSCHDRRRDRRGAVSDSFGYFKEEESPAVPRLELVLLYGGRTKARIQYERIQEKRLRGACGDG